MYSVSDQCGRVLRRPRIEGCKAEAGIIFLARRGRPTKWDGSSLAQKTVSAQATDDSGSVVPCFDEARIRLELSGNLCRCNGYLGLVNAIKRELKERAVR